MAAPPQTPAVVDLDAPDLCPRQALEHVSAAHELQTITADPELDLGLRRRQVGHATEMNRRKHSELGLVWWRSRGVHRIGNARGLPAPAGRCSGQS